MTTKVCSKCQEEKFLESFNKDKNRKDGLYIYCKDCLKSIRQASSYSKEYYKKNKSSFRKRLQKWQENNREKARAYCRKYYEDNRESEIIRSINKRQKRLGRTIALSPEQEQQIKDFYWLARDLSLVTGEVYHVDHIVPLQGNTVCGLHVPWNLQVLPADINLSKGNKHGNLA